MTPTIVIEDAMRRTIAAPRPREFGLPSKARGEEGTSPKGGMRPPWAQWGSMALMGFPGPSWVSRVRKSCLKVCQNCNIRGSCYLARNGASGGPKRQKGESKSHPFRPPCGPKWIQKGVPKRCPKSVSQNSTSRERDGPPKGGQN